jgi:hypothetical protein
MKLDNYINSFILAGSQITLQHLVLKYWQPLCKGQALPILDST